MHQDDEAVRERLKRLVAERSQSEIARKTGAQVAAVNRYVHGARIPASFCSAVVRGLGVNPSWLLMGEGSPYLADVPARTARLGENLLELVEAMSTVSRMLIGSLAGKRQMKVLRELNDALLAQAAEAKLVRMHKVRTDTTVVGTAPNNTSTCSAKSAPVMRTRSPPAAWTWTAMRSSTWRRATGTASVSVMAR